MAEKPQKEKLSEILSSIFLSQKSALSYGELVDSLDHHGMAIVLILFSLPSALPVPAPGYSTILSIPLLLIGLRLLSGFDTLWLPQKIRQTPLDPEKFSSLVQHALKAVLFIERFSRARLSLLTSSRWTRPLLGVLILALACSMALPIPGTNTLPAGGIFLIGFSLLEDDGLLLLLGCLYSLAALTLTILIITMGYEVVKELITFAH